MGTWVGHFVQIECLLQPCRILPIHFYYQFTHTQAIPGMLNTADISGLELSQSLTRTAVLTLITVVLFQIDALRKTLPVK